MTRLGIILVVALALGIGCGGTLHAETESSHTQLDIAYGPHPLQRLDMHWPADTVEDYPVVVFIHGGGLESGDKQDEDYGSVYKPFVQAGFAFATINYRLLSDSAWPAQARDCAAAINWVRQAMTKQDGAAHPIFLMGHSSGAMLAALFGADDEYLSAYGMKSTDLAGVIPMGSIMWDEDFETAAARIPPDSLEVLFRRSSDRDFGSVEAYRRHWPMGHINASMPPYLFLVAEGEKENPPVLKHAIAFCDSARTLGVTATWAVLNQRTHTSAIRRIAEPGDPAFAAIQDFIQKSLTAPTRK